MLFILHKLEWTSYTTPNICLQILYLEFEGLRPNFDIGSDVIVVCISLLNETEHYFFIQLWVNEGKYLLGTGKGAKHNCCHSSMKHLSCQFSKAQLWFLCLNSELHTNVAEELHLRTISRHKVNPPVKQCWKVLVLSLLVPVTTGSPCGVFTHRTVECKDGPPRFERIEKQNYIMY